MQSPTDLINEYEFKTNADLDKHFKILELKPLLMVLLVSSGFIVSNDFIKQLIFRSDWTNTNHFKMFQK